MFDKKAELRLYPHQEKILSELRQAMRAHKRTILMGSTGLGKCLGKGTEVILFNGHIKKVENITPGDVLIGPDSRPKRVLSTCHGHDTLYKVTPVKGRAYIVNESHILSLRMTGNSRHVSGHAAGDIVNIPILEYFTQTKTFKHCAKGWRSPCLTFETKQDALEIPPYILGVWLGDGSHTKRGAIITNPEKEIVNAWTEYGMSEGYGCSVDNANGDRCPSYHLTHGSRGKKNNILEKIRELGLWRTELFIPEAYKSGSVAQRLEILAGLLDTDGYFAGGCYEITTKHCQLSKDIAFVARSLGLAVNRKISIKKCQGWKEKRQYYRLIIAGHCSIIPCRLDRKKAPDRLQKKNVRNVGIKVEPVGPGDYYGFTLDGDGLFLLGDFTVTHNTELACQIIKNATEKGKKCCFVAHRINLVNQTSERFSYYGLLHGVIQADNPMYFPDRPVQICSIQTLSRRKQADNFDIIIFDEIHVFFKAHEEILAKNQDAYVIGLSATPFTKGLGKHFTGLCHPITLRDLINQGALKDFDIYGPAQIDLSNVRTVAGEYKKDDLEKAADQPKLTADIVDTWVKYAKDLKTICFCSGVAHGRSLEKEFNRRGINAKEINGYMPKEGEDGANKILHDFGKDKFQIIISTEMLVAGFDETGISCVILAVATRSRMKFVQALGRGLRKYDGIDRCVILDHGSNTERLGFPDEIEADFCILDDGKKQDSKNQKQEKPEKLPKKCPSCEYIKPAGVHVCPACGFTAKHIEPIEVQAGELVKLERKKQKKDRSEYTLVDKQTFLAQLNQYAADKGYKMGKKGVFGWAIGKYVEKFGSKPPNSISWNNRAIPGEEVLNWIKHTNIKYAKGKSKDAPWGGPF
ncbi:MAG: DEAD/DEAH box helicase family protein [Bacilli bacterium]